MTSSTSAAAPAPGDTLKMLNAASSAEDFFTALGVPYDEKVVHVARLHILKRMGEYLAHEDFDGLSEEIIAARCKANLQRAYDDFVASSPLDQRVFKVLKEAVEPAKPANFVPFEVLLK